MKQPSPLFNLSAAMLLGVVAVSSSLAASTNIHWPGPGLYRIDFDGQAVRPDFGVAIRQQQNGTSGDVNATTSMNSKTVSRQFKGNGQNTICVPKNMTEMQKNMGRGNCTTTLTQQTKDGFLQKFQCPGAEITHTSRQTSATTWEMTSTHTITTAPIGSAITPNSAVMEAAMAAKAITPDQLAEYKAKMAAYQIAEEKQRPKDIAYLEDFEKNAPTPASKAQTREARERMTGARPTMQATSKQIWTRIGDNCSS